MNAISLTRAPFGAFAALILLVSGCVRYEELEQRIVRENDDIVRITLTYYNFRGEDNSDFRGLIEEWKGDKYLVEKAEHGMYVVSRMLSVEKGKLTGMVQLLTSEGQVFADSTGPGQRGAEGRLALATNRDSTGYWQSIDTSEVAIVSTNGSVTFSDTTATVRWPSSARELLIRTRDRDFTPPGSFADSLQTYLRDQKGH